MICTQRMDHVKFTEELNENKRKVYRVQNVSVGFSSHRASDIQVDDGN